MGTTPVEIRESCDRKKASETERIVKLKSYTRIHKGAGHSRDVRRLCVQGDPIGENRKTDSAFCRMHALTGDKQRFIMRLDEANLVA